MAHETNPLNTKSTDLLERKMKADLDYDYEHLGFWSALSPKWHQQQQLPSIAQSDEEKTQIEQIQHQIESNICYKRALVESKTYGADSISVLTHQQSLLQQMFADGHSDLVLPYLNEVNFLIEELEETLANSAEGEINNMKRPPAE